MATLGTTNLGIVKNENSSKDSNLFNFPMPYSDSSSAYLIDLMGTSRTITISGEIIGTKSEIQAKIAEIEGIQNGHQTSKVYNGELITGKNVQIQSFSWDYQEGVVNRATYTLTLMEGGL